MAQGREALLVRVAELYYEQGMSQQNIAELLGMSRPTVSRLLEEARACGVVEITVHSPLRKDPVLSARLRRELGLRDAVVLSGVLGVALCELIGETVERIVRGRMEKGR